MTKKQGQQDLDQRFWRGLTRALGGAITFSLPILVTQEVWHLGFTMVVTF